MKVSIRQAGKNKERWFDALADFANLGDSQADWERLRLKHPEMFTEHWLYIGSEEYAHGLFDDDPSHVYSLSDGQSNSILQRRLRYRDCLRSVWSRNDRDGKDLRILYGLDLMDDEELLMGSRDSVSPLPPGKPVVDGHTGEITWVFPSVFQQALYELMKKRRRAKTCPQCGRYFFADKSAQAYCSPGCSGDAKNERSLDYFNREGRARRIQRRKKEKGK